MEELPAELSLKHPSSHGQDTRRNNLRYKVYAYTQHANGGRGMANLRHAYEQEVVGSALYLLNMTVQDQLLQAVVSHQLYLAGHQNRRYSNLQAAGDILGQYRVVPDLIEKLRTGEVIPEACEGILVLKAAQDDELVGTLMAKPIHRVYYQQAMAVEGNNSEGTFAWLSDGRFWAETEGLVFAAQDGVIMTNRYKHIALKVSATSTCRMCQESDETVGHILSSCAPHVWSLYKERHDWVMYQLMLALAKKLEVRVSTQ